MSDPVTARVITAEQLPDLATAVWGAFYGQVGERERDLQFKQFELHRTHGIFDGEAIIGGGTMLSRTMPLPGGVGPVPVAAVTSVGVAPDQRRRGALSELMRAQLHGLYDGAAGGVGTEAVAALWASEGGIYGRFGYGLASRRGRMVVPTSAALRADVDPGERVVLVDPVAAGGTLRKLYAEYAGTRIGMTSRTEPAWELALDDQEDDRGGASAYRYAVVSDGYVTFRVKPDWEHRHGPRHQVWVQEIVSLSPRAHAALWRFLLRLDLAAEVRYSNTPLDDPLPWMLDNPRHASMELADALFVRLVDLGRALGERGYAAPLDVVFEVTDAFCPWNAGRWRVLADASGRAAVQRSDADPDLACDVSVLGAAFLGSTRLTTLAAAGRVRELRPGALRAVDTAFSGEHEPHCLDVF